MRRQLLGLLVPVIAGNGDEHRSARRLHRDVPGTLQGARHIRGACRLDAPLHVRLRQLGGALREQERIQLQQRTGLLSRRDHQRRAIAVCGEYVAHRVADTYCRVQVYQRGAARGLRIAVGHAHRHRFLQGEHILEISGKIAQEREFGGTRIAEDPLHAEGPQQAEGRFTYCRHLIPIPGRSR